MDQFMRDRLADIADQLDGVISQLRDLGAGQAPARCGHVRDGRSAQFPCVRDADHTGMHADRDGDAF